MCAGGTRAGGRRRTARNLELALLVGEVLQQVEQLQQRQWRCTSEAVEMVTEQTDSAET